MHFSELSYGKISQSWQNFPSVFAKFLSFLKIVLENWGQKPKFYPKSGLLKIWKFHILRLWNFRLVFRKIRTQFCKNFVKKACQINKASVTTTTITTTMTTTTKHHHHHLFTHLTAQGSEHFSPCLMLSGRQTQNATNYFFGTKRNENWLLNLETQNILKKHSQITFGILNAKL